MSNEADQTFIDRFLLGDKVGEGAMGVVHAAYDQTLDRKIAVKLIAPKFSRSAGAQRRFLQEARAMARVSHGNVVQIYQAGRYLEHVFIAMEFVPGRTLRDWMSTTQGVRSWPQVLSVFTAIAQGLCAAHAAEVIHRDFKPENVLLDADDRPKVADFGLAGLSDPNEGADSRHDELQWQPSLPSVPGPGETVDDTAGGGTPTYMSPEQHLRETVDARTDQFSYCVALYEALYGHRPFEGDTLLSLTFAVTDGTILPPRHRGAVPAWLHAIVLRGLRAAPEDRFASMSDLLAALRASPRRRRRRLTLAVAGALAGTAAAVAALGASADTLRAWWSPVTVPLTLANAHVQAPMRTWRDPAGAYVSSAVANKGRITYDLALPRSGRYYVWGLVWELEHGGARGDADSFFFYVDAGEEFLWHIGCQNEASDTIPAGDGWRWQRVARMQNSDSDCSIAPVAFDLAAGEHEVVVRNREGVDNERDGVRLARLVVTNDADFRPDAGD